MRTTIFCLAASTIWFLIVASWPTTAFCQDEAEAPEYGELMTGVQHHYDRWRNKSYRWKQSWRIISPEKSILTFEVGQAAIRDNSLLMYWLKVDDPKGFPNKDVSFSEGLDFTIDSELGSLLSFYRSMEIQGQKTLDESSWEYLQSPPWDSSRPFESEWSGMLLTDDESSEELEAFYGLPFFDLPFLEEFEANLPTDLGEDATPTDVTIGDLSARVYLVPLKGSSTVVGFSKIEGDWWPIYYRRETERGLPDGAQSVEDIPEPTMHRWPRHTIAEGIVEGGGSQWKVVRRNKATYFDGYVDESLEEIELTDVDFSPTDSDFVLPVNIPDGTPVQINEARQIKAEWRDGKIVKVYRGDVVETLATSQMRASPWKWYLMLGSIGIVLVGGLGWFLHSRRTSRES